ncbi:DNA ligase [Paenibacillus tritici]|uniref:DNA ligase n=1 Tax=Paenibacillus tritici TaxID=1873425 RepID=A0ABX2DNA7_9BACL|nr:DNA ligase [Paenibacillus tritici]NQX46153.1 DNA ligase [Paenibacillus tritici]
MNIGSLVRSLLGDSKAGEAKSVELKQGQVVRGVVLSVSDSGKEAVVQIQGTPVRAELETPLAAGQTLNLQVGAPGEGGLPVLKPVSLGEAALVSAQSMGEAIESLGLANSKAGREIVQAMQAGGLAFTKETAAKLDAVMNAKPPGVPVSEWLEAAVISVKRGLPVTAETVRGLQQAVFGPKLHQLLANLEAELNVWAQQSADGEGAGDTDGLSRPAAGLLTGGANAAITGNTLASALPGATADLNAQAVKTGGAGTAASGPAGSIGNNGSTVQTSGAIGQAVLAQPGDADGAGAATGVRDGAGNVAGAGNAAGVAGARDGAGNVAGVRNGAGTATGARDGVGAATGARDGVGAGAAAGMRDGTGNAAGVREATGTAAGAREGAGNASGMRDGSGNVAGVRDGVGNAAGMRDGAGNVSGAREGIGNAAGIRDGMGNAPGARDGTGVAAGIREGAENAMGVREVTGNAAGMRDGAGATVGAREAAGPALLAKLQGVLSELRGSLPQLAAVPPASGAAGGSPSPAAAPPLGNTAPPAPAGQDPVPAAPRGDTAATQGTDPWVGRILKLLGAEHEQQVLRGGGAGAAPVASGGAEDAAGTLKGVLLQVLGSSEIPPAVKEAAGQLVQQLTGQQLLLNTDRTAPFAQVTMFLPLQGPDGRETASVHIQSRRGRKGELDAANCRLWFDLDMKQLGQTMVDVQVVDRIVSLRLHNDQPWVLELLEGRREEIKAAVESIGYQLSSLRTDPLPELSVAAAAAKPSDYAPNEYKGVDYRI